MYSHELSCKKNPHNDILCTKCIHGSKETLVGDDFSKCGSCKIDSDKGLFSKVLICEGCHGYGGDRTVDDVYRCDVDGKLMYNRNIVRMERSRRKVIVDKCDREMPSKADGCVNFIKR